MKKKCSMKGCNKKLKLTDLPCRCKYIYCIKHRLPETHNCTWNPKNSEEMAIYKEKSGLNIKSNYKKVEII